jgi:DNA-binding transcriptional LysR family regulator
MPVSLYRLQVLCEVVDQRSFSRAAERLVVTQPVVSRLIADMERHYGVRLFVRQGRRVTPTDAGLLVYRYAREVLRATDNMERLLTELADADWGALTVAVTTAIGSYTFPLVWQQFWSAHPRTQLVLKLGDSQRVLEDTRDGAADLGLAITSEVPPDLTVESLGSVDLVLVGAATHPLAGRVLTPPDLVGQTLLCTNSLSSYQNLVLTLDAWGIGQRCPIARFGDTEAVKRGAEIGLGLAQLARVSVARELADGRLTTIHVDRHAPRRDLQLVQPKHASPSTAASVFAGFLREHADSLLGHA